MNPVSDFSEHPFGLETSPFAVAPDPRFVWLGADAGVVLERLQHDVIEGGGGIALLIGGNGSGKTLLAQCLLERLIHHDVRVARVLHSRVTPNELLQSVCDRLRVPMDGVDRDSGRDMVNALSRFLMDIYAQGLRVLLVVDEAQNLSDESLEQLRLLTNLQTPAHQLMHILLLATPVLRERLRGTALGPLAQRITAWHELSSMNAEQSEAYIRHRLQVAGVDKNPFSRLALRDMHRASHGIPRLVNLIGERALAMAAARETPVVGERVVQQAAREALPGHVSYWLQRYRWWWLVAALVLAVLVAFAWWGWREASPSKPAVTSLAVAGATAQQQADQLKLSLPPPREARLQAWSELLARWQVGSDKVGVAEASQCQAVIFPGFDCVGGTGTLDQLANFDRPLVLVLTTPRGKHQVLLLGVGKTRVRLMINSHPVEVSRQALVRLWQGYFYAPFRLPATLPSVLRQGDKGPAVAWLAARLALSAGKTTVPDTTIFDAGMVERVRRLQRRFGIPDDGIVGPETLFALTSQDAAGPHLAQDVP